MRNRLLSLQVLSVIGSGVLTSVVAPAATLYIAAAVAGLWFLAAHVHDWSHPTSGAMLAVAFTAASVAAQQGGKSALCVGLACGAIAVGALLRCAWQAAVGVLATVVGLVSLAYPNGVAAAVFVGILVAFMGLLEVPSKTRVLATA